MIRDICGIYMITNTLNNKFYIGCSLDIKKRWDTHRIRYKTQGTEYNKPLYIEMREFGIKNFKIEVLEECKQDVLFEREKHYIETLNAIEKGYNVMYGEDNHGNAKLTSEDVILIRTAYNNKERKQEVYKRFSEKINHTGFHKVWNGYSWKNIMMNVYTQENKEFHKKNSANIGSKNGTSLLTEKDVIDIRLSKKNGLKKEEVYQKYKETINERSFLNVWYGYNWTHITV